MFFDFFKLFVGCFLQNQVLNICKNKSAFFCVYLCSLIVFKSNERSEESYIGLADFFFQEKT